MRTLYSSFAIRLRYLFAGLWWVHLLIIIFSLSFFPWFFALRFIFHFFFYDFVWSFRFPFMHAHEMQNELKRQNIRKQIMEIYLNEWNYHYGKPLIWLMGDELMANMHVTRVLYRPYLHRRTCFCRHFFFVFCSIFSCVLQRKITFAHTQRIQHRMELKVWQLTLQMVQI